MKVTLCHHEKICNINGTFIKSYQKVAFIKNKNICFFLSEQQKTEVLFSLFIKKKFYKSDIFFIKKNLNLYKIFCL